MESESSTSGEVTLFRLVPPTADDDRGQLALELVAILLLLVHVAKVSDKPTDVSSQKQRNTIYIVVRSCDEVGMCW